MSTPISSIRVIEAAQLVSGVEQGGLIEAVTIAAPGSVRRRPPVFVNSRGVPPGMRDGLNVAFSQKWSVNHQSHLLSLTEPLVVGQGSVIVRANGQYRLLWDSAREFLAHHLTPDGMERDKDELFTVRQPVSRRIEQSCLLLQRPWSNNFGHWLVDQAMALSYLVHIGALPTNNIVVCKVTSPRLRDIMLQTLTAILPGAIVHEHPNTELWQFNRLNYIMPLHIPPLSKLPAALDALRKDLLAVPVPHVVRPRRLHIVRGGIQRRLVNEPEIMALSATYGFECVSPENFSMAEQAVLFNQAEAILGVKGAAMTNILFAEANCRVMLISPGSFVDPFFWDIASTRGIAYAEIFGSVTTDRRSLGLNDFYVSPADVKSMIEITLAAAPWSASLT